VSHKVLAFSNLKRLVWYDNEKKVRTALHGSGGEV
jgi:hypothetical protein